MPYFKNLKFKLLFALSIVLAGLFLGFGTIVMYTLEESYKHSIESTLFTVIKDIKHDFNENPQIDIVFDDIKKEFDVPLLYAQIGSYDAVSNHISILQKSQDLGEENLSVSAITIQAVYDKRNDIVFTTEKKLMLSHHELYIGTFFLANSNQETIFLQCAIPYPKQTPQIQKMLYILAIGLSLLWSIILFLAYKLIQASLLNVQKVSNAAKALQGKVEHPIIEKSNIAYEIDDLIETFNILFNELQEAYAHVKQFGQNASHELKTPLTIMQGEIEVGLKKERTREEYEQILQKVLHEVTNLHAIVEKILFLSSNTKHEVKQHFSELYLDEILLEAIEEKRAFAKEKNIQCVLQDLEPQSIQGNHALLKIALANLIDNAIKYSSISSTITFSLLPHKLSISDEGMGMNSTEMMHIFEQFYRTPQSKLSTQGSGLGLAIVKSILELHECSIDVQSAPNKGTCITITFH